MPKLHALLKDFRWAGTGADEAEVERVSASLGLFPVDYLAVLSQHNGGEGFVGDGAYLRLWPIGEIEEANTTLEVKLIVPGVVMIGSDGADDLYGIETESSRYLIFPAVGLSAEQGEPVGESWDGFLAALSIRTGRAPVSSLPLYHI